MIFEDLEQRKGDITEFIRGLDGAPTLEESRQIGELCKHLHVNHDALMRLLLLMLKTGNHEGAIRLVRSTPSRRLTPLGCVLVAPIALPAMAIESMLGPLKRRRG